MRLVFAGTPEFAVPALDALVQAGHDVAAVFTQPDRPAGRGQKLQATAVAERAIVLKLPVHKPARLDEAAVATLRSLAPDVMVVVAYGLILPQAVLDIPRLGCLNIHASLLPRWRGAAPIQRAILAGDTETGVTIMQMDAGLDTGGMLLQERVAIAPDVDAGGLHDVLAPIGARRVVDALAQLAKGALVPVAQPATGATYAKKIGKAEARLDWTRPALELSRQVRAFNPAPVAWAELGGERVRVFRARASSSALHADPGTVVSATPEGVLVATGEGALAITELQWPGGRVLKAAEAVAGRSLDGRRFS